MNSILKDRTSRITSWLAAIEASGSPTPLTGGNIEKRPPKRARTHLTHPTDELRIDAPQTPPLTDTQSTPMAPEDPIATSRASKQGCKRRSEQIGSDSEIDDDEALEVPLPHQAFWVGHRRRSLSRGSGRSRSRRGRETRDDLKRLEKPINLIVAAQARGNLPADVVPLYKEICDTNDKDDIFPHEARKEVELLDPYTKDRYFRKPNPDPAGRARAKEMFTALSRIVGRAGDMQNTARSEASWNMFVHGPLLDLVYSGDLPRPDRADEVRVQWDYITTATIAGGSIPFFRSTAYQPAEPALTISTDTSVLSPSEEGSRLSLSQMRSSSVKVDFVLALNASEKTPLRRAISSIINHEDQAIPHVNQTAYQFLKDTPIAVSIETKKETTSTESIMQLGLWTAAWYKHMYGLREHLAGPGPKPSFGSILLIQIIGHTWQVYCVHDSSSSIDVRGPFLLGSTDGITSVYVLLKSLEAIRRWTEDTFYTSVQRWFLV